MNRVKKALTLVFLMVLSVCGLLAGCRGKYDDVKVSSDRDADKLVLFLGQNDGTDTPDTASVTFSINNAPTGMSNALKFNFIGNEDNRIVHILDTVVTGYQTKLTLQAISGGTTTLEAITEEGGKKDSITIVCQKTVERMDLVENYSPAIINKVGATLSLDTSKLISFYPSDTTQNKVKYELEKTIEGLTLSNGVLTINQVISDANFNIIATNTENDTLTQTIKIKVVSPIETTGDDTDITLYQGANKIDAFNLCSNRQDESYITFDVDVNTTEKVNISCAVVSATDSSMLDNSTATVEKLSDTQFIVRALTNGTSKLKISVNFSEYDDVPVAEQLYLINVIQIADTISVNDNTKNYNASIYTSYKNNLGEKLVVQVGNLYTNDNRYVVALASNEAGTLQVVRADGSAVGVATITDDYLDGEYTILPSGAEVYVKGTGLGSSASLIIFAYGTYNHQSPTKLVISCKILIGATSISATIDNTVDEDREDTLFVEVGKSIVLPYSITSINASTEGLNVVPVDETENQYFSTSIDNNSDTATIKITGTKAGTVAARIVLGNLVTSKSFVIFVFEPISDITLKVDSPLTNKNVAQVEYSVGCVAKFSMTLGVGLQVSFGYTGTLYGLKYSVSSTDCISVSSTGYITSKHIGTQKVVVTYSSLITTDGVVELVLDQEKQFDVTVFIPISSIALTKSSTSLYFKEDLNNTWQADGKYKDSLSLDIFPKINLQDENLHITWIASSNYIKIDSNDLSNIVLSAQKGDNDVSSLVAYVAVSIEYYGTTYTKSCIVNVLKFTTVKQLTVSVEDADLENDTLTSYFDIRLIDGNDLTKYTKQLDANVYPDNATDKNIIYVSSNTSIAKVQVVNGKTKIIPAGEAGVAIITIYAEDLQSDRKTFKTVKVVVADGTSSETAYRIKTESDFANIGNTTYDSTCLEKFYYFANSVYLTKNYSFGDFNGQLDGRNYYLQNVSLLNGKQLFNSTSNVVKNLNITANFDISTTEDIAISCISGSNSGSISNVNITYTISKVVACANTTVEIGGLVLVNESRGVISNCSISMDLNVVADNATALNELYVGGIAYLNNGYIYGGNNNYKRGTTTSYSQNFDFVGSIVIDENITATQSAIGGIVALNKNDAQIGSDSIGQGLASNASIVAKNIDNVGGLVGSNNGKINNSITYADILGHDNVGGLVGSIIAFNMTASYLINSSIVEIYQDLVGEGFGGISGNNNVGGLVGLIKGMQAYAIYHEPSGDVEVYTRTDISITHSYIKSYTNKAAVNATGSTGIVGGIVGNGEAVNISSCFSNVNLKGYMVGGLLGYAIDGSISNCYTMGEIDDAATTDGSLIGENGTNVNPAGTKVTNSYTTIKVNDFVKQGVISTIVGTHNVLLEKYKADGVTEYDWKNYNTYSDFAWDITNNATSLSKTWNISSSYNDGYPVLVFDSTHTQEKLIPTSLSVEYGTTYTNVQNGILVLNTNKNYNLSDILSISTDSQSSFAIYVTQNTTENVFLGRKDKNGYFVFSSSTNIESATEQLVTFTFKMQVNPSVVGTIKVLFVNDDLSSPFIDDISVRKSKNVRITAFIDNNNTPLADKYYIGIKNYDTLRTYFTVDGSSLVGTTLYFNSGAVLNATTTSTSTLEYGIYKKIVIDNIDTYFEVGSGSFVLKIYVGATKMTIDNTQINMSLIDIVYFTVKIYTDDEQELLQVAQTSGGYFDFLLSDKVVKMPDNLTSEVKLLNLSSTGNYDADGQYLIATFTLKVSDELIQGEKSTITKAINTTLIFTSSTNSQLSQTLSITLNPQNILKVDMNHFPAGEKEGNEYKLTTTPSNTLTPGQVGMLTIDIYPIFANYEKIVLESSVDESGNYITFNQLGKYVSGDTSVYYELMPNPSDSIYETILSRVSNLYQVDGNFLTTFDGTFYVNTLVGSKVKYNEIFTVTFKVYYIDENDEEQIVSQVLTLIVEPSPEVVLEIDNSEYSHTSYIDGTNKALNLFARGTDINVDVSFSNFTSTNGKLTYSIVVKDGSGVQVNDSGITGTTKDVDNKKVWTISCPTSLKEGYTITIYATLKKTVNGFEEVYKSDAIELRVVDFIITGIELVNITENSTLTLPLYVATGVQAKINYVSGAQYASVVTDNSTSQTIEEKVKSYQDKINNIGSSYSSNFGNINYYWYYYINSYTIQNWTETNTVDAPYSVYFKNMNNVNADGIYIYSTKQASDVKFLLCLNYNYKIENGSTVLNFADMGSNIYQQTSSLSYVYQNIDLNIKSSSTIDKPYPVNSIKEFLSMSDDTDYILMCDLAFGTNEKSSSELDATSDTYTPFKLSVKSLDCNSKTITINGGLNITGGTSENLGLFTSIASGTVLENLNLVYANTLNFECAKAEEIYFGGLSAQNEGVVTNCHVVYTGDVVATSKVSDCSINMAGFVSQNSGKITYSTVHTNSTTLTINDININNIKLTASGNLAGFANSNGNLISNCEVSNVGLNNTSTITNGIITAGFVGTNSKNIYGSSVSGQIEGLNKVTDSNSNSDYRAMVSGDTRFKYGFTSNSYPYFATLVSKGNIAGFVYTNSGNIRNAYSNIPMDSQSRTAGFVFQNQGTASIMNAYTASYCSSTNVSSTANAPFTGTNELGEVQNNLQTCTIKFCYYISTTEDVENDETFKEPASCLQPASALRPASFVGFDFGVNQYSIWQSGIYLPTLNANEFNYKNKDKYFRDVQPADKADPTTGYIYFQDSDLGTEVNPYEIATAQQLLNKFSDVITSTNKTYSSSIRLIDDIDFTDFAGTDMMNILQTIDFVGDFDGNGMTMDGIRILGNSSSTVTTTTLNDSFGFFKQIGSGLDGLKGESASHVATESIKTAHFRNVTLKIKEIANSTSAYTGILAGVIVNTKLSDITVDAEGITVLGKNVVGGIAGAILGYSEVINVSTNANVTAGYASDPYTADKTIANYNKYNTIAYQTSNTDNNNVSYAGGIAGVIDILCSSYAQDELGGDGLDGEKYDNGSLQISSRNANINMVTVSGDVVISGSTVGGLFGWFGPNAFMANSQFVVSTSNAQRLSGTFASGGLVGLNQGGVIYLSKVEIAQSSISSYDTALTNQTGNSLFGGDGETTPTAIGGIFGISFGGGLLQCYSKTNVVNYNTTYAGGLIGYSAMLNQSEIINDILISDKVSNSNKNVYNRYNYMQEVYTTGNVFAGANYTNKTKVGETDKEISYNVTATSFAGGIIGCDYASPLDYYESVIGINAFHRPSDFTLPTDTNDKSITFGNIASGYIGSVVQTNGMTEKTTYPQVVGAFIGYFAGDSVTVGRFKLDKHQCFDTYAYNDVTITENSCSKSSGETIKYIANKNVSSADSRTFNVLSLSTLGLTTLGGEKNTIGSDGKNVVVSNANIYLALHGTGSGKFIIAETTKTKTINFADINNGTNGIKSTISNSGIYANWTTIWQFNSPIYPTFKPQDTTAYIKIENESQLRGIATGRNYILTKDIYLTSDWTPRDLAYVNLTSERRTGTDSYGLVGSSYYVIYNINIVNSANTSNFVGFFGSAVKCSVKNVNFVFGTKIANPDTTIYTDENPWSYTTSTTTNITGITGFSATGTSAGLIYGNVVGTSEAGESAIDGCQILFVNSVDGAGTSATCTISANVANTMFSFGLIAGRVNYSSGTVSENATSFINSSVNYCYLTTKEKKFSITSLGKLPVTINIPEPTASESLNLTDVYIGGVAGYSSKLTANSLSFSTSLIVNNYINLHSDDNDGMLAVGGAVGFATGLNMSGLIFESNIKIYGNSTATQGKTLSIDNLCVGEVAGYLSGTTGVASAITSSKCSYSNTSTSTDFAIKLNDIKSENAYIGGMAGKIIATSISNTSLTLNNAVLLSIQNCVFGSSSADTYIGGFAGLISSSDDSISSSGLTVSGCDVKINVNTNGNAEEKTKNINIYGGSNNIVGKAYIAGFAGYVNNCDISDSSANGISLYLREATMSGFCYVGGFIGGLAYDTPSKIISSYASGLIDIKNTGLTQYVAGFVAYNGITGSNQNDQYANILFDKCISDVAITLYGNNEKASLCGFTCQTVASVSYCLVLGNINCADYFTGIATGFVGTTKKEITSTNFTLSTINIVGDGKHVNATNDISSQTNTKSVIIYSYNMSGVMQANINRAYTYILEQITNESSLKELLEKYDYTLYYSINEDGKLDETTHTGTKLNPYNYSNDEQTVSGKYYIASSSANITKDILGNLIADDGSKGVTLTLKKAINVSGYVSGIEFLTSLDNTGTTNFESNALIATNSGYIFNCISSGKIVANDENIAGFVKTNNGNINACTSMTLLDANGGAKTISGFALTNTGIITNSFVASTAYNTSNATTTGFVMENSGYIRNSVSSFAVFDINAKYDNSYPFVKQNSISSKSGDIKGCYYDTNSLNKVKVGNEEYYATGETYSDLNSSSTVSTSAIFGKTKGAVDAGSLSLCYGYAMPISYIATTDNMNLCSEKRSSIYTGDGKGNGIEKSATPIIINNIGRFYFVKDFVSTDSKTGINYSYFKLINDLNAESIAEFPTIGKYNSNNSLEIINDSLHAIYGLNLKGVNNDIGFICTNFITIKNLGLVVKKIVNGDELTATNVGLMVSRCDALSAVNCYATIDSDIVYNNVAGTIGLFAGNVNITKTGDYKISNCFASGNITVKGAAYVGGLVGSINCTDVSNYTMSVDNSFASGLITLSDSVTTSKNTIKVGGLFGSIKCTKLSYCYSNVTIKNLIMNQYYQNATVGAIAGFSSNLKRDDDSRYISSTSQEITDSKSQYKGILTFSFTNSYDSQVKADLESAIKAKQIDSNVIVNIIRFSYTYTSSSGTTTNGDYSYDKTSSNDKNVNTLNPGTSIGDISITTKYYYTVTEVTYSISHYYYRTAVYDRNIALVNNDGSGIAFETTLTNTMNTFDIDDYSIFENPFDKNSSFVSESHLPIQKIYKDNRIVYSVLDVTETITTGTGSKMSPYKLNTLINISSNLTALTDKYCYISEDIDDDSIIASPSAPLTCKMIIGSNHIITTNGISNLFGNAGNCIISGLTVSDAALASQSSGYIYNVLVNGTIKNSEGGIIGFINYDSTFVIDSCEFNGVITNNKDSNYNIGAILGNSYATSSKVKDCKVSATIIYTGSASQATSNIGGIISIVDSSIVIINPTINSLIVNCPISTTYTAGISTNSGATIYGTVKLGDISSTASLSSGIKYLGGIFAKVSKDYSPDYTVQASNNAITLKVYSSGAGAYVGLFGQAYYSYYTKVNLDFEKLKIQSPINITGAGASNGRSQFVGSLKAGGILGGVEYSKVQNITMSYNVSFYNCSGTTYYGDENNYFGGIIGQAYSSDLSNISMSGKVTSETDAGTYRKDYYGDVYYESNDESSYIGGIVGSIVEYSTATSSMTSATMKGDVNVKVHTGYSTCYVGGLVGAVDAYGSMAGCSITNCKVSGLVAAYSDATCQANFGTTSIYDARSWKYEERCQYYWKWEDQDLYHYYGYTGLTNYIKYEVTIPLSVGGAFGITHSTSYTVTTTGSVRALLTNAKSDMSYQLYGSELGEYDYRQAYPFKNNETMQCRAGAYSGLTFESNYSLPITKRAKMENRYLINGNHSRNGKETERSRYFKNFDDGYIVSSKITNASLSLDLGKLSTGLNYDQWNGLCWNSDTEQYTNTNDHNDGSTQLSLSSYTTSTIFDYTNDTYSAKGGDMGAYDINYDNSWGNIKCNSSSVNSKSNNSVFAGFIYGSTTYNRSYWYVGNTTKNDTDGMNLTKNHEVDFYVTEHWAGSSIGGIICS